MSSNENPVWSGGVQTINIVDYDQLIAVAVEFRVDTKGGRIAFDPTGVLANQQKWSREWYDDTWQAIPAWTRTLR